MWADARILGIHTIQHLLIEHIWFVTSNPDYRRYGNGLPIGANKKEKKRWESNENKFNELTTCGTKNILSLPQILLIVLHWIAHRCCTYSCWPSADDNLSSVSRIPVRRVDTRKKKERKRRKYKINLRLFWTMKYTEIGQQKWIFFPLSVVLIGNEKTSETHVPPELKLHAFDRI